MTVTIQHAETDEHIQQCFPALKALRPHLDETTFLAQVKRQQMQGYRLLFLQTEGEFRSVAGYRILEFLAWGKILYIDDLITLPGEKRKGYAGQLLDWLIAYAKTQGCAQIHLDSGYQRHDAHRLYLNKGLDLNCHHFALQLPPTRP
ncbi:MAG: GNAT family N-acetyltransferase [Aggregatilineales bacterium]